MTYPLYASATLPSIWMALPFVALLLCIALLPLISERFWHHHYGKLSVSLGLVTGLYYLLVLHDHEPLVHTAIEFVNFMALVGSLFVISGCIHIKVKGEATPLTNTLFLAIGAVLANLVGTTGASMLLIRPWITANRYRITDFHIVFFIFIVSNCGGSLTPVGDPPLFLGYLRGVPFLWTLEHAWPAWLMANGLLLAVFFFLDRWNFNRAPQEVRQAQTAHEEWTFRGLHNIVFLLLVLAAAFSGHQLAALVMIAAAVGAYFTTSAAVRDAHDFSFGPILEIGWLFIGIFLTMLPALAHLQSGNLIALHSPLQYYFTTGLLSALLDNAPTYLAFLASAMGEVHSDVGNQTQVAAYAQQHAHQLLAISLGAVFFGAGSYIGNGPNFMVKAIAEKAGVKTPGFLTYIVGFTLPILIPILTIVGWICLGR